MEERPVGRELVIMHVSLDLERLNSFKDLAAKRREFQILWSGSRNNSITDLKVCLGYNWVQLTIILLDENALRAVARVGLCGARGKVGAYTFFAPDSLKMKYW